VKNSLRFLVLGASVVILAQACGSSDDKKKKAGDGPDYTAGGEGGEMTSGGGSKSGSAGMSSGANGGVSVGTSAGEAGQSTSGNGGSAVGEAGMSNQAGTTAQGGAAGNGAGDDCPVGFGECDNDPTTVCEQNLSLITSCGDCKTTCSSTNGTTVCENQKCVLKGCDAGYADCNSNADDACETALTNNATNCGACGRDCTALGSTCASNKCNEIPLQKTQPVGSDSSGNVNWTYSQYGLLHTPFYGYTVWRFPLDGKATQVVWDQPSKMTGTQAVLAIGDDVYWAEQGTGGDDFTSAVYKKPILAAADVLPTLAFGPEWKPQFLRQQGNALYWFSGDYQSGDPSAFIYTRALNAPLTDHGTKIMSVDQGTHNGILAFNVTSDALYWVSTKALTGTANELRTAPIGGGTPTAVPAVSDAFPTTVVASGYVPIQLQVMGAKVYFNRHAADAADGIYSFQTGDAAPTLITKADSVTSFVLDADFVYFTRQNTAGVWKASLSGSAGVQIADDYLTKVVAQDSQFVYAIQSGCCNGDIYKIIK
jgi:hypothetical protein